LRNTVSQSQRDQILALLQQQRDSIAAQFGVLELSLFGSAARDDMHADSDVDVLVDFRGSTTFDAYFGLKDYLERLLGRPVDLVPRKGLKPRARQHVAQDLIRVT
jgi:uncharacterized protein